MLGERAQEGLRVERAGRREHAAAVKVLGRQQTSPWAAIAAVSSVDVGAPDGAAADRAVLPDGDRRHDEAGGAALLLGRPLGQPSIASSASARRGVRIASPATGIASREQGSGTAGRGTIVATSSSGAVTLSVSHGAADGHDFAGRVGDHRPARPIGAGKPRSAQRCPVSAGRQTPSPKKASACAALQRRARRSAGGPEALNGVGDHELAQRLAPARGDGWATRSPGDVVSPWPGSTATSAARAAGSQSLRTPAACRLLARVSR